MNVNLNIEKGHFGYWIHKFNLGKTLTLTGHSRGASRTGLVIPELGLYLDAGIPGGPKTEVVFLTHGHTDHSISLPVIVGKFELADNKEINIAHIHKPRVYCPYQLVPFVTNNLKAHLDLISCNNTDYELTCDIIGVDGGEKRIIRIKNNDYLLETFNCDHGIPCVGFGLSNIKKKLKDEYRELKGFEIKQLRDQGIDINNIIYEKMFVFMGDTTEKVFSDYPSILEQNNSYPYVIVECNFIHDDHIQAAKEKHHTHWINLKPFVKNNPNTMFILIHFSMRYKMDDIVKFFDNVIANDGIKNIHIWENSLRLTELITAIK